jgi:hypothetical protein
MSTKVRFKLETNVDLFKVLIDENELEFDSKGIGETQLIQNHEYSLYWYFYGEQGKTYDLSVIEPKDFKFHVVRTLDSSKKDCGVFWIKI